MRCCTIVVITIPLASFLRLKRTDKGAGPSGREVISLQKVDSLRVSVDVSEAKKVLHVPSPEEFKRENLQGKDSHNSTKVKSNRILSIRLISFDLVRLLS
jgi:hypothetical protein